MSLRPDSGRTSGRSPSRSRDDRDRSHSTVPFDSNAETATKPKSKKSARFADEDDDDDDEDDGPPGVSMPSIPGASEAGTLKPRVTDVRRPTQSGDDDDSFPDSQSDSDSESYPPHQATRQHGHSKGSNDVRAPSLTEPPKSKAGSHLSDDLAYGESSHSKSSSRMPYPEGDSFGLQYPDDDAGPTSPRMRMPSVTGFAYANPEQYKYAEPPENLTYTAKPSEVKEYRQTAEPQGQPMPFRNVSFSEPKYDVREIKPREERKSSRSNRLSVDEPSQKRASSPAGRLSTGMNRLSVNIGHSDENQHKIGKPPASPLLDAYHGTYQSISPMPSPIMLPQHEDAGDLDSADSISDADLDKEDIKQLSKGKSKLAARAAKKRVKLYDAEGDAEKLAAALNHHEARPGPLIDILPELTHDQLLALRNEYKKRVKVQGRGVNIAKQIKALTNGNFSKVTYATALGRWESEAYWANFWYQARSANRELLIEALMGRSNADIREIKDGFRDKRYHDDLSLCMERELKPDKFRQAVLLALEGDRQEDTEVLPPEYRDRDVEKLHRALKSREGGETAIMEIVVTRSNNHLRDVLRTFEKVHKENLARAALKKSTNLVGEVIAHILNGVINRPARDSLLLRHAINDVTSKEGDLRYELLMSRLIRLHWDRSHLSKVKEEYEHKYKETLERSVKKATKGDFGAFCVRLCET